MTLLFVLYDALATAAVWLLLVPFNLLQILLRRDSLAALGQRLGSADSGEREHVVIHGVSVGEILAAEGLVAEIDRSGGGLAIVLSSTSRHGLEVARQIASRHSSVIDCRLLPWDSHRAIRNWLRRSRPQAVVVIETEIWPNLFRCCAEAGIPIAMASARIYRGDFPRYALLRPFFTRVLSFVSLIGAQSVEEALRFRALGAGPCTLAVLGDLKTSAATTTGGSRVRPDPGRPVVVAGCTHPGEETLVLQACREIAAAFPGLLLVIAPRDVGRARDVTNEAGRIEGLEVRVVDRVGELRELYGGADVAVIGGSLVKRGGHSPLEAFASGCPVVIGPHFENVEALVSPFLGTGALSIVTETSSLGREIARFLSLGRAERTLLEQKLRDRLGGLSGSPHAYAAWLDGPRVTSGNSRGARGRASVPPADGGTRPHGDSTPPRIGKSNSARVSL